MPYDGLDKARLSSALRRLGELALQKGTTLEVSLYGGAVFALVYDSRPATKDVDALVQPSTLAGKLALQVAKEQALPEDWLNDDVKQFLAAKEEKRKLKDDEFGPGLRVSVPTAAYLLALKLRAARRPLPGYDADRADIRFLVRRMKIRSVEEAEKIHDRFFPHDVISEAARAVVSEAIENGTEKS